jgi:hypothetical protein
MAKSAIETEVVSKIFAVTLITVVVDVEAAINVADAEDLSGQQLPLEDFALTFEEIVVVAVVVAVVVVDVKITIDQTVVVPFLPVPNSSYPAFVAVPFSQDPGFVDRDGRSPFAAPFLLVCSYSANCCLDDIVDDYCLEQKTVAESFVADRFVVGKMIVAVVVGQTVDSTSLCLVRLVH